MAQVMYNEALPENNAPAGFVSNNTISFVIKGDGLKLMKNSLRFDFDLEAYGTFNGIGNAGNILVRPLDRIGINNKIGGHAFISEMSVETQQAGVIESLSQYQRMANVLSSATMSEEMYYTQTAQAEGRQVCVDGGRYVIQAQAPNAQTSTQAIPAGAAPLLNRTRNAALLQLYRGLRPGPNLGAGDTLATSRVCNDQAAIAPALPVQQGLATFVAVANQDATDKTTPAQFSIKPLCCLNRAVGDDISLAKQGFIRVDITLGRASSVFQGGDATGTAGYIIKRPRLRYMTRMDAGAQGKVMMNTSVHLKSTANSQFHNVQARVPLKACSGVALTYIEQSHAVDTREDSLSLEQYPRLDRLEFLFADNNKKFIQYPITDKDAMRELGVQALSDSGEHQATLNRVEANDGTIHGLSFQQFIDLTQTKFSVQLTSSSPNLSLQPRDVHLMFMGLLEL